MKISIIIPIYNVDKYLRCCLDSVIRQTYDDIEIICVNDGSTDSCADILSEYQQEDNRIRIITQENKGTLLARKAGIENAEGNYIICLDPDDWLDFNAVELVAQAIGLTDSDVIQFGFTVEQGTAMPPNQLREIDLFFNRQIQHIEGSEAILTAAYIDKTLPYNQCGKAIRTSIAQQAFSVIPEVRCNFAEDQSMGFVLFCYTHSLHSITNRLYHYRAGVGISTKKELTLAEYKEALNSFHMLDALKQFVTRHFESNPLHHKIISDIQLSMISTCTEFGVERTVGYKDAEERIALLCERILSAEIPLILANKLSEKNSLICALKNETTSYKSDLESCRRERDLYKQERNDFQQEANSYRKRLRRLKRLNVIGYVIWILLLILIGIFFYISYK